MLRYHGFLPGQIGAEREPRWLIVTAPPPQGLLEHIAHGVPLKNAVDLNDILACPAEASSGGIDPALSSPQRPGCHLPNGAR